MRLVSRWTHLVPLGIVFCSGINLILIQWVMVRELSALLLGTEMVILLVSLLYFLGLSIGYRWGVYIPHRWIALFGITTFVLHLSLPVWFRLLVAQLEGWGAYWAAFVVIPMVTPAIISSFYSIFLPRLIESERATLPALYGTEILGSIAGVGLLTIFGGMDFVIFSVVYGAGLLLLLAALQTQRLVLAVLFGAMVGWLFVLPEAQRWSNSVWYEQIHALPDGTHTLFSGYSPYQKVDVLEVPDGDRYLFLDGLEHFGSSDGYWLNVILGRIPASLMLPEQALVFGAGSMQMELMIANYAGHVTTVEIDPLVVEVSRRYFQRYNRHDELHNRTIIIDDAKHFIANTDQTYDLIATDLPAAFTIQTATLYALPFYTEVAEKLSAGGVFAVNLTSTFTPDDTTSRRITAALLILFDEVYVITSESAGWSFAYAGDDLPFTRDDVAVALEASGETSYLIYETAQVRDIVGDAEPITLDSLDIVLTASFNRIRDRLGWNE